MLMLEWGREQSWHPTCKPDRMYQATIRRATTSASTMELGAGCLLHGGSLGLVAAPNMKCAGSWNVLGTYRARAASRAGCRPRATDRRDRRVSGRSQSPIAPTRMRSPARVRSIPGPGKEPRIAVSGLRLADTVMEATVQGGITPGKSSPRS